MLEIKNRIIVFGGNHYNTLGLIRSVGIAGYKVTVLLQPCNLKFCELRFSKYIEKLIVLKTTEEALEILRNDFKDETSKPIILCASDSAMSLIDNNLDELRNNFYFFNIQDKQGEINRLQDKTMTFPLAEESGFSIIKTWCVNRNQDIPADITFPCLIKGRNSINTSKE